MFIMYYAVLRSLCDFLALWEPHVVLKTAWKRGNISTLFPAIYHVMTLYATQRYLQTNYSTYIVSILWKESAF